MSVPGNTAANAVSPTRRTFVVEPGVDLFVTEVVGPRAGPTLAIVAGVHGDEVECIALLEDWVADIRLDAGRVLALPVAHPAALRAGTRLGPDGVDLNRVAPGDPSAAQPTVRLAHALTEALSGECDVLVTLHSWSRSGETVPYVEYPATGDPAVLHRATELAHHLGLEWAEPWAWPEGLLPAALCRSGVPSVEIEIGGLGRTTPEGHAAGRRALDAALSHLGLVTGPAPAGRAATVDRSWVRAGAAGRVRQLLALGDPVERGQVVAQVRAADGRVVEQLAAEAAGTVAVHVTYGAVEAGEPVAVIFTPR